MRTFAFVNGCREILLQTLKIIDEASRVAYSWVVSRVREEEIHT